MALAVPYPTHNPNAVYEPREASRVVASVLLAAPLTQALIDRANNGLMRLSLAPLTDRDSTPSTPEELAPLIPPHLRDGLADLLLQLAGDEPLRHRMATSYMTLWACAAAFALTNPRWSPWSNAWLAPSSVRSRHTKSLTSFRANGPLRRCHEVATVAVNPSQPHRRPSSIPCVPVSRVCAARCWP
jgi:hypothetical protein